MRLRPRDRLCVIAGSRRAAQTAREAGQAGAGLIQLRRKRDSDAALAETAEAIRRDAARSGARLIVNSRTEVAARVQADGAHIPERESIAAAREILGEGALIGYSAHSAEGLRRAEAAGADYAFLSPVFPTGSKPGAEPLGLERFAAAAAQTDLPVYALGGVVPENAGACLEAGAFGVAALSPFLGPLGAGAAARDFLRVVCRFD